MLSIKYHVSAILLAILFILIMSSGSPGLSVFADEALKQRKNPYTNVDLSIKIIPSVNKTFGYDILLNGKSFVHQPTMPGLPGNEGFNTKEKAQVVAEFVVKKIRNNEMPPTVTIEDLRNMNILN